jgi:hypothetical protein
MNPAYERIYHYHIRKTAGTSLNSAFWALGGVDLQLMAGHSEVTKNGLKFVRFDRKLIAAGDYFFANSHQPAYQLEIPPNTFTVTILRDPAARVVSYYRYLLWAKANPTASSMEPSIEWVRSEATILTGGFSDFLTRIPTRRLLTQVFMFSKRMDPVEAADKALACTAVCFTETFSEDLKKIAMTLQLDLEEKQERRFGEEVSLTEEELDVLRERLAPEYAMIERIREGLRAKG